MTPEKLRKQFIRYRRILGMTQTELADTLGYGGFSVISHKERGTREVTRRDILAMERLVALAAEAGEGGND